MSFQWQKQPRSLKQGDLKNFAGKLFAGKIFAENFTGKHLCWGLLLKNDSNTSVYFCEFCVIFRNTYFEEHLPTNASAAKYFMTYRLSIGKVKKSIVVWSAFYQSCRLSQQSTSVPEIFRAGITASILASVPLPSIPFKSLFVITPFLFLYIILIFLNWDVAVQL